MATGIHLHDGGAWDPEVPDTATVWLRKNATWQSVSYVWLRKGGMWIKLGYSGPPSAPQNFVITSANNNFEDVTVQWTASAQGVVTGYEVVLADNVGTPITTVQKTTSEFEHTFLVTEDTQYILTVQALGEVTNSSKPTIQYEIGHPEESHEEPLYGWDNEVGFAGTDFVVNAATSENAPDGAKEKAGDGVHTTAFSTVSAPALNAVFWWAGVQIDLDYLRTYTSHPQSQGRWRVNRVRVIGWPLNNDSGLYDTALEKYYSNSWFVLLRNRNTDVMNSGKDNITAITGITTASSTWASLLVGSTWGHAWPGANDVGYVWGQWYYLNLSHSSGAIPEVGPNSLDARYMLIVMGDPLYKVNPFLTGGADERVGSLGEFQVYAQEYIQTGTETIIDVPEVLNAPW